MLRISVLLALLLAATACGDSGPGATTPAPTSSPTLTPSQTEVELAAYIEVDAGPVGLAATKDGTVWVVTAQGETVQRIPPGATSPDLTVEVPGVPLRATAAYNAIWVTSFHGEKLMRLDPATGAVTAEIATGAGPEGVAAGFGSVWLVVQDAGKLLRIDPERAKVTAEIDLGVGARLVAPGPDAMYVAHYADNTVLRVDPATNTITPSKTVCEGPQAMVVLEGKVWVTCTLSNELVALDSTTLAKVATVPVEGSPDSVAATADGQLAVVAEEGPRLVVVDPGTAAVVAETVLGEEAALGDRANLDLALVGDEAWVSSFNADRVYHSPLP